VFGSTPAEGNNSPYGGSYLASKRMSRYVDLLTELKVQLKIDDPPNWAEHIVRAQSTSPQLQRKIEDVLKARASLKEVMYQSDFAALEAGLQVKENYSSPETMEAFKQSIRRMLALRTFQYGPGTTIDDVLRLF
jgi:hypothetical protein